MYPHAGTEQQGWESFQPSCMLTAFACICRRECRQLCTRRPQPRDPFATQLLRYPRHPGEFRSLASFPAIIQSSYLVKSFFDALFFVCNTNKVVDATLGSTWGLCKWPLQEHKGSLARTLRRGSIIEHASISSLQVQQTAVCYPCPSAGMAFVDLSFC